MNNLQPIDSFCTSGTLFGPKNLKERSIYSLSHPKRLIKFPLLETLLGLYLAIKPGKCDLLRY